MFIPIILAGVGAGVGHAVGKKGEEEKSERKLELVKKLANLTPEQAEAVDAVKKQPVQELEDRVTLGIGPFGALPPQASERARAIRQARIDEAKKVAATLSPDEVAQIKGSKDPKTAIREIVDRKIAEKAKGR